MMKILIIITLLLIPTVVLAVPDVTGVSAQPSEDAQITITGTGFGDKATPLPQRASFNHPTSGMSFQDTGTLDPSFWWENAPKMIELQDSFVRVPGRYYNRVEYSERADDADDSGYSAGITAEYPQARDAYLAWWDYFPTDFDFSIMETGGHNIKDYYLGVGDEPHSAGQVGDSNTYFYSSVREEMADPCDNNVTSDYSWHYYSGCLSWKVDYALPQGEWFLNEVIVHMSADLSTPDGWREYRVNNRLVYKVINGQFYEPGETNSPFYTVMRYGGNYGFQGGEVVQYRYQGGNYQDMGFNRIYIGDAATFTDCTHLELQIPTSWEDTSAEVVVNQGSFQQGSTAYVYIVDSSNVVNPDGYEVTFGGAAPPSEGSPLGGNSTLSLDGNSNFPLH